MSWTHTRSQIAHRKKADPDADVTDLRRQLKAERLEEYIRSTVDAAPELTASQRERIASLLRPSVATNAGEQRAS
jgi:hypothetical protein